MLPIYLPHITKFGTVPAVSGTEQAATQNGSVHVPPNGPSPSVMSIDITRSRPLYLPSVTGLLETTVGRWPRCLSVQHPDRYDVTVTVARDGGRPPDPADFAVATGQAASSRAASVVSAHTARQIISVVTVEAAGRSAAVAVALRSCPKQ